MDSHRLVNERFWLLGVQHAVAGVLRNSRLGVGIKPEGATPTGTRGLPASINRIELRNESEIRIATTCALIPTAVGPLVYVRFAISERLLTSDHNVSGES